MFVSANCVGAPLKEVNLVVSNSMLSKKRGTYFF